MMSIKFSAIEFSAVKNKTSLTKNYSVPPLKVIETKTHGPSCFCFLTNYGAGFVEGDHVGLTIHAGSHTNSIISTQGNTRVYKSTALSCRQSIEGTLDPNAFHVFLNDPLVLHTNGAFTQRNVWRLAEGAVLLLIDWFSAGRVLNKESFNFKHYQSETKVYYHGVPILWDNFHIDPQTDDVTSPAAFHDNTTYLNVFLLGEQRTLRVQRLEEHIIKTHQAFVPSGKLLSQANENGLSGSVARTHDKALVCRYAAGDVFPLRQLLNELVSPLKQVEMLEVDPLKSRFH